MDCYEAVSGARMHATYYRPGGVYRDLPDRDAASTANRRGARAPSSSACNEWREGSMLDFLEAFTDDFPHSVDEYETLLTDNRIWKQRTVGIGVVPPEHGAGLGHDRPDAARFRHRLGPAQEAAVRDLRQGRFRHSGRRARATATTATWCASRKCASRTASSSSASTGCRRNPGPVMLKNFKVAPPSREEMKDDMEALIHHFKLFTEGYCVPAGEIYCRGRGAEGRVRLLPDFRRRQQAVPRASCARRASPTCRRWTRSCAATCCRTWSR